MKKLLTIVLTLIATLCSGNIAAQTAIGDWKLHPAFDYYFKTVIDTDDRTYVLALEQKCIPTAVGYEKEFGGLFVYDKQADEFLSYNSRNYLSEDVVSYIAYNQARGYLLIVYENSNIDLLFDDDTVYNIPGYMSAAMTVSKDITHVTFDAPNSRAYLATQFGYFVINDQKGEIAESHIYNTPLNSVGRVGNRLIAFTDHKALSSPIDNPHLSLSDFTTINGITTPSMMLPLSDDSFAFVHTGQANLQKAQLAENSNTASCTTLSGDNVQSAHTLADGAYFLLSGFNAHKLERDGRITSITIPEEHYLQKFSSADFSEFWFVAPRKGLTSLRLADNAWTITHDYFMPSAPAVFRAWTIEYSPDYGMLHANEGMNPVFTTNSMYLNHLISGYKDGRWTNYGGTVIDNPLCQYIRDGYGPSIDPIDPDIFYIGTYKHGLFRINIATEEVAQYSYPNDKSKALDGFHSLFPASSWEYCKISEPVFDADGTLWLTHDTQSVTDSANSLYYWTADDRKSGNTSGFKSMSVKTFESKHFNVILPLKKTRNIIMLANGYYEGPIWALDHNGTLDDTSDDRVVKFNKIQDQDGNEIPRTYVYGFHEDMQTGRVWVHTFNGVFTINPSQLFNSDFRGHRIKVARNDGTNQADYLLDGVPVYDMAADGGNRKWFATGGVGIVLTSADGTEVIRQLTTDNSYIPDNLAYTIACDNESNSVWVGTNFGIAQYLSDSTPAEDNYDNVKAYPNPVRPDYYGWVTIEGLVDNSLVKIADASGAIVKELGRSSGGMISWDVTNLEGRRVKTGVYYVLASQSEEGGKMANVTKILVVN